MGLDVTAYRNLTLVRADDDEDESEVSEDCARIYVNSHFEAHDDLVTGYYSAEEDFGFRAGSYSEYNHWRSLLARMTGTTAEAVFQDPTPGPFVEMINFSDCEGVIGGRTCAKLAGDFADWRDRASTFAAAIEDKAYGAWWLARYDDWSRAYRLAAGQGAVKFH